MNHNFILISLIFLISFDFSNGSNKDKFNFSIEQICQEDIFKFDNSNGEQVEINTIIKSQLNNTFLSISRYITQYSQETISSCFENKNHGYRMVDLLKLFNNKIYEIYSDDYLNNRFDNIGDDFKLILKYYKEIKYLNVNHMNNYYFKVDLMENVENGLKFVKNFDYYRSNKLKPTGENFISFKFHLNIITGKVSNLKNSNLTYALDTESEYELFVNYGLFLKNKFIPKIDKDKKIKNTLILDFFLPYYDKNYNNKIIKDCVRLEKLPSFFRTGKKNI